MRRPTNASRFPLLVRTLLCTSWHMAFLTVIEAHRALVSDGDGMAEVPAMRTPPDWRRRREFADLMRTVVDGISTTRPGPMEEVAACWSLLAVDPSAVDAKLKFTLSYLEAAVGSWAIRVFTDDMPVSKSEIMQAFKACAHWQAVGRGQRGDADPFVVAETIVDINLDGGGNTTICLTGRSRFRANG
jgi:hypothetical protein